MWAGEVKTNQSGDDWTGYGKNWDDGMVLNNVHGLRILENVVYDTMGHTIYLETGAEIANIISNNARVYRHAQYRADSRVLSFC